MFKIIVIDDDINLNFLIAKVLTKNGYQVYQCYNAESAYDVLDKNYIELLYKLLKSLNINLLNH